MKTLFFFTLLAWCLHNNKAERGTSNHQRKKGWLEPNNYKRGGGSKALDPPTWLKTHPPRPPPLQLNSYKRSLMGRHCTHSQFSTNSTYLLTDN